MAFKMTGYSYPGKSPVKQEETPMIHELPMQEIKKLPVNTDEDKPLEAIPFDKEAYDRRSAEVYTKKKNEKKKLRRESRKETLKSLGDTLAHHVLTTGIKLGLTAVTRPKKRTKRKKIDTNAFSNVKFTNSNIFGNNSKQS